MYLHSGTIHFVSLASEKMSKNIGKKYLIKKQELLAHLPTLHSDADDEKYAVERKRFRIEIYFRLKQDQVKIQILQLSS